MPSQTNPTTKAAKKPTKAAVSDELQKHLQSIAAQGGRKGGKARMDALTPDERQLLAIKATMNKLRGAPATLWLAQCVYRRKTYTVMGCASDPERQFREASKAFPKGAECKAVKLLEIDPEVYIDHVKAIRAATAETAWKVRALIQARRGEWFLPVTTGSRQARSLTPGELTAWTTRRKPGRPRKED